MRDDSRQRSKRETFIHDAAAHGLHLFSQVYSRQAAQICGKQFRVSAQEVDQRTQGRWRWGDGGGGVWGQLFTHFVNTVTDIRRLRCVVQRHVSKGVPQPLQ